jgi:riboflavin transporter FmnP
LNKRTCSQLNTKTLTLIIVFVALSAALNIAGPRIPAPYAPFLFYQLWEIPIVLAFIAISPKVGVAVTVINTLILFAVFNPGANAGPLYNLIAILSMFSGIYIPYKLAVRGCKTENFSNYLKQHIKLITFSATALGITMRVIVTTVVNYFVIQQPYPIGYSFTQPATLAFLPLSALFNATVALYTIPIAIAIAIPIISRFKL